MIRITTAHGSDIATFLDDIAALRIQVFREFPYLYEGTAEYEKNYLQTYLDCPDSVAVLAWDDERLIGVSTGLPMRAEVEEFQRPFIDAGIAADDIFYCAESVLLSEYRGQGIYREFFAHREAQAKRLGSKQCVFCAVVRPEDHPDRPEGYIPLDEVWGRFGYERQPGLTTTFAWLDIGDEYDTEKPMQFYSKTLL